MRHTFTTCLAAATLLAGSLLCTSASAGEGDYKERELYRLVSAAHRTTITMTSPQGSMTVKDPNTLITMTDSSGKQIAATLMETGGGSMIVESLKSMKPGDYASATFETKFTVNYVKTFSPYKMFEGETLPNVFAFVESAKREQGTETQAAVQVYKLGKIASVRVPSAKDTAGKAIPDPKIMAAVEGMQRGDVVEVEATGSPPVIKTFAKYLPPVTGIIAEVKQADIDGGTTTELDLTVDSATRTFLVPGTVDAKGVFQPTPSIADSVKRFKAKDHVVVKYRTEGGKDFIREIARAAGG